MRYGRRRQVLYSDANRTAPKFTERDAELQSLEVLLFMRQLIVRMSGERDVNEGVEYVESRGYGFGVYGLTVDLLLCNMGFFFFNCKLGPYGLLLLFLLHGCWAWALVFRSLVQRQYPTHIKHFHSSLFCSKHSYLFTVNSLFQTQTLAATTFL